MNVVQLQDMLRGLPDDRLKQELSQPTGTVPQYLVLSEVVRRDKIREAAASAPQTTVLQDVVGTPTAPQAMPQAPAAYANGGFISPSQAMGNAGFKGFAPSEQKQPMQFGFNQNPTQMFTPNTTPQPPAPVTNTNVNVQAPTIPLPQPQFDGGQSNGPNAPSYYEQPNGYADGGIIGLDDGGYVTKLVGVESGFNPRARNPRSTAGGLGQFIDSTWLQFLNETQPGLVDRIGQTAALQLKDDADLSKTAIDWYKGKNTGVLTSAGFEPSDSNLYLAHFLGGKGATDVLNADPNTPAIDIVGEKVVNANPFLRGMSAADVINWSSKKMGGSPTEPSVEMASMNPADREAGILSGGVMPDPRKRGIMDLFAEEDTQKGLKELGASLFAKGQEKQSLPELEPIRRGDPSLVKGIVDKTPDQLIAEYRALRQGYMANGGVVKMRDGSPGEVVPEKLVFTLNPLTGTYTDQNGKFYSRNEAQKIMDEQKREEPAFNPLTTTTVQPGGEVKPGAPDLPPPNFFPAFKENPRPVTTGDLKLPPAYHYMPESAAAAEEDAQKVRAARDEAEKRAAEIEANRPTAFSDYLTYLRERDRQLQELYQEQADEERRRQEEAGGLPFLLRQLGIGMIASGGNLQQGLRGGLEQAFKAREEQTQAARDKIRELQLKQKMAGLEGSGDIAKLIYQSEIDRAKTAAEREPTITNLIALRGQAVQQYNDRLDVLKDEAPEVIQADPVLKGLESQIQSYDIRLGTYTGGAKIEKIGP